MRLHLTKRKKKQTIFGINFVNVIYFFVTKQSNDADPLKIIVTSLATVLTCTMTMRVILLVRGSLVAGGSFHGSTIGHSSVSASGGTGAVRNANTSVNGPFHITASGPGSGARHGGKPGGIASPPRPSNGGSVGGAKYSQPTFAVPRPEDAYDNGKYSYGGGGGYGPDGPVVDVDIKAADVADEVDDRVWQRTKEDEGGLQVIGPQNETGRRKEAWE